MTTHLAVRSCYSLLEGTLTIPEIVRYTKQYHLKSVALCDRNVLFGAVAFYRECVKNDIKPIIGMEADVMIDDKIYPFIVLAKNNFGYQNLLACSTYLNSEAKSLTLDELESYAKDCIVIALSENGPLEQAIIKDRQEEIVEALEDYKARFPDFYFGFSAGETSFWSLKNQGLRSLSDSIGVKRVALSRVLYGASNDDYVLKTLMAIKNNLPLNDERLVVSKGAYYRDSDDMMKLYDMQEILESDAIAAKCNVDIYAEKASLPVFSHQVKANSQHYLFQLCHKGLEKRFARNQVPKHYEERLLFELKTIFDMHYEDYFLIVWDYIRHARKEGIYVGPGRGSAAGSIVAWSLGITHVDPIRYDLLFERFLNPERISLPDIDTDFPDNRRDEVIRYVADLYGQQFVAHILTFGTFGAKQAIRDIGRCMSLHTREVDALAKAIPYGINVTLERAYKTSTRFRQIIQSDVKYREIFELAKRIEGLPRHISTHAAGIVMSSLPLIRVVPLIRVEPDMLSTQITMEYLEDLGLIKMDFLGLRNLTIIDKVVSMIKPKIDILKIPLDDRSTYKMIGDGDTVGIFQLESDGMKNLIRQMKPERFTDISATIALYRPGPMENIPQYLKNRANPHEITYLHDDLKPILNETFGIIIYQEQIMQIAQLMAGFSLGKADILRKAMSKKNASELIGLKDAFIDGCRQKGYAETLANQVYELILKFANYGFNKSHSVAYSLIAYQMAYLKANYPLFFFCCLLDSAIGSEVKTSEYINECRKRRVEIKPISVNSSQDSYRIEDSGIRLPLLCIKGVGSSAAKEILDDRLEHGVYKDYFEFVARINLKRISRSVIAALIDAGALDEFKLSRNTMTASLDDALHYADLVKVENGLQTYIDLGLVFKPTPIHVKDTPMESLRKERDVLGFYLSEHPMSALKRKIGYQGQAIVEFRNINQRVRFLCHVQRIKNYQAKTGPMAFVTVDDESQALDLVVLPNTFEKYAHLLEKGKFLWVEGRIDKIHSCVVDSLKECI